MRFLCDLLPENAMAVNSSSFPRTAKLEKRRMKESNLQVVSDRLASNQLQYHYGNTAYWLDESSFNYASDAEEHQPYTIKTRGIKSFFKQHT